MNTKLTRAPIVAALFAVSACAGSASIAQAPPFRTQNAALRTIGSDTYPTNESLVYVGNIPGNDVYVYRAADLPNNPPPIATIATEQSCPYGLAADKQGTIYVAAGCAISGGDVEEYPKGSTTVQTTITDGISHPSGLAIDRKQTLYVVDSSPPSIEEYAPGATAPKKSISGSPLLAPFGAAVDANGNLYVADFDAYAVFELPAGGSSVKNLNLQDLVEPIGVAVDQKHGLLWVTDGEGQKVNVYQLGSTTPIKSIGGFAFPYAVSVENKGLPTDTVVISDNSTSQNGSVLAYKPGKYTPYATLTTDLIGPASLLITKP